MVALRIFLFFLLIDCNAQKLELHNKEKLAKVLEDIRARIISDDDVETVEGSGFSSDEQFVANLVVRPGFPVSQHKPKLEFMPHFEHENFEFMVPEGVSEKSSVMAILPFYSILDSAVPEFKLNGNGCEYLEIGDLTVTQTDNYALAEVPIIKKKGINFLYGNGSYSLWITATQRGMENKAKLSIEVIPVTGIEFLSIRPGSLELTDAGEYSDIVGSGEEPANQKQVPPELEIVVSGAKDGIFSISENLPRFSKIPNIDIQVHFKDHSIIQDYIELSIEPSDLFAPRPQIVSPGEPVKLVVLDSNLLDFEVKPSELTFKLNARLRGKWKEITQKSVILKAEKVDESDQAPIFEREHYLFVINTTYGNNAEVGEIKASDPDSSQNIQYTLLGEGSSTFKLDSGVLIIDCGMAEKCFDQEKEYHLLAMAVDQTGRTSKPASIVIKIESTLADECYIETSRKELTVKNGHLITPLNFIVNNLRRNSIPKFDVKLEGKGAKYFEIEKLTRRLHNLKLIDDIPDGIYVINIILSQQSGKQRTTITVTSNTEKKIELEQKKYSINLNDIPIYRGQSIINLKTNGKHQNGIRYVIKGSKDWISLNTKTGEIIVTRVPEEDQNVNLKVVAYNKKTGKVIDKATVNLQYKTEKVKTYQVPESRVLYYNKDGLKFKKEKGLKTRKIVGYTHNQREVLVSNGSYNGDPQGEMFISNDMLKSFLFMQIFFVSSDNRAVVYSLLNENTEIRQKPAFGYPWISDFDEIKVKITDESHDFICLPCIHKGNIIDNVTLQADQKVIFNKTNGCLNVASRITEEHQIQLECWGDGERTLATIRVAPASETLPFDLPFKTISVEENIEPDTIIARYSIKDTFKYMYKISGDYSDFFEIQLIESEVIIKTNHKVDVDYEAIKSMPLFVTVSDQEENSKIGVLQINVIDQNDNYPIIASSPKLINIYNHWDKNVTVGLIKASDLDDGDNGRLEYRMLEPVLSFLDIDHEHGIIKTSDSLDKFAREEHYQLSVKVTDHGNPAKSAITDIPVFVHTLIDSLNKQIQIISPSESCVIEISEDEKINTTVFKAKAVLTGIELDDALLKYYISSESEDFSSYFKMDEEMGAMSLIRGLDYEESAHFTNLTFQTNPNQPISEEDTMRWMKRFRRSFRGKSARKTVKPEDTVKTKDEKKNKELSKKEKKTEPLIRKDTIVVDPNKKLIVQRTRSVTHKETVDKESRDPPEPLVTHFPVNNPDLAMTSVEFDKYGGMSPQALWGNKSENYQKPNQESGYNSPLEVQVSPINVTSRPNSKSNPRSPSLQPSRFSSPRSPDHLGRTYSHPLNRQRFLAKSESNLRRILSSDNSDQMVAFLRQQVQETKYVTAVFESAKGGIAPILGDIVKEMSHWLGTSSRLLAVACEVHWSVPEKIRSRVVEIRMKEELHRVLRQNNSRVLRLYDENGGVIPLHLIDSKTEENCARDAGLDAFQGIYRRYYPALLNLQDYTTIDTHKSYWTLENLGNYRTPLQPAPTKFMYRPSRDILAKKSIVALNMAVLRMHGDDWDYENEVKLEVKSLLSGVSPAYRLLNITVINVDEHQPHFSLSEAERIIYLGNETIALRAEDDDLPPFNSIYYYLLPKCGNTKFAEINDISGKLAIKNNIPDGSKICVYASPIKLNDDIGSIYYDKHNKAMIKIIIKRADLTPSSTSIFLDSDLRQQSIDLKIIEPSPDLHYHLKSIRFYPLKGAPVDVNDLISVDSGSGVLLFEPRIIDEPEGTYQININLHGLGDVNSPVQHLVYYIRDYNQLRFVFDNSVDNVGLNLEAFKHQLEVILSSQRRRNVTVINGRSCGLTESNRKKKTKICFFLTEQDKILDYDTSLDWLSTTSNANPRLIDLYSKFRVVDVDRCLNINSLLLHSSTSSLDREQLVWLFVIFCLITLIILLISYSCLVKRVKDRVNNGFFNAL